MMSCASEKTLIGGSVAAAKSKRLRKAVLSPPNPYSIARCLITAGYRGLPMSLDLGQTSIEQRETGEESFAAPNRAARYEETLQEPNSRILSAVKVLVVVAEGSLKIIFARSRSLTLSKMRPAKPEPGRQPK